VLLVADVARAGRVPEVHHADRARAGQLGGELQLAAVEQRGLVVERAQVARLEGGVDLPKGGGAEQQGEAHQGRFGEAGLHGYLLVFLWWVHWPCRPQGSPHRLSTA